MGYKKQGKTDSSWKDLMHEFGAKTRGSAHVNYEFKKGKYFRLSIMAPDELGAVVYEPILHVAEQGNGEEGEIVQHEQKLQWKKFNPKQLTAPVELVKSCIEAIEYVSKVWDSAGFTQAAQQTVKDLEENVSHQNKNQMHPHLFFFLQIKSGAATCPCVPIHHLLACRCPGSDDAPTTRTRLFARPADSECRILPQAQAEEEGATQRFQAAQDVFCETKQCASFSSSSSSSSRCTQPEARAR